MILHYRDLVPYDIYIQGSTAYYTTMIYIQGSIAYYTWRLYCILYRDLLPLGHHILYYYDIYTILSVYRDTLHTVRILGICTTLYMDILPGYWSLYCPLLYRDNALDPYTAYYTTMIYIYMDILPLGYYAHIITGIYYQDTDPYTAYYLTNWFTM